MAPGNPIITFRLPDRLLTWVRAQARLRRISVTEFIRELIEQEMNGMGDKLMHEVDPAAFAENRISALHSKGTSLAEIARILNGEGVLTARGGSWYASTISNVVKRLKAEKKKGSS